MADLSQEQIEQLQALLAEHKTPAAETVPAVTQPQGFSLNLGGNQYQVRDQSEAQRLLEQFEAQRGQELEAERVKTLAAQQRLEQLEAQYAPRQTANAGADTFDKDEYARLFLDDPRKASRYALQHDKEQIQFYQGLVSQIQVLKQEQAAGQFLLQHKDDYKPTPGNFKAINDVMSQLNLPWNVQGMNAAFAVAGSMGQLEGTPAAQGNGSRASQIEEEDGEQQFVPAPRVARRRSSTNSGESDIVAQFEDLTPDKMKAYLESLASR